MVLKSSQAKTPTKTTTFKTTKYNKENPAKSQGIFGTGFSPTYKAQTKAPSFSIPTFKQPVLKTVTLGMNPQMQKMQETMQETIKKNSIPLSQIKNKTLKLQTQIDARVLSDVTKKWVENSSHAKKGSFKVGTAKSSMGSSTSQNSSFKTFDKLTVQPISFANLAATPIQKPLQLGIKLTSSTGRIPKPVNYVQPVIKIPSGKGNSGGDGSDSGGGIKIGTFHPDRANIIAQNNPGYRAKEIM